MIDQFWHYTVSLYKEIPSSVYLSLLIILFSGSALSFSSYKLRRGWRIVGLLMLTEHIFLLLGSTVFFRKVSDAISGFNFQPFWSYVAIQRGRDDLITENVMNTIVFVPVGLLLGIAFRSINWRQILHSGFIVSVIIEILQLLLKRGFAEIDDVIHNTLGCMIGYGIYLQIRVGCEKIFRRQVRT